MKTLFLVGGFFFLFQPLSMNGYSAIYSVSGSNLMWNSVSTWSGGVVPHAGDSVIISIGSAVLITDSAEALEIRVYGNLGVSWSMPSALHVVHSFRNSGQFLNNRNVYVDDNFYNDGSLAGSGAFCISDSTSNTGMMTGSFDFCDMSPPSNPPYIDNNTGTVDPLITWCTAGICGPVGIQQPLMHGPEILYHPSTKNVAVQFTNANTIASIVISDERGLIVFSESFRDKKNVQVSMSSFSSGIYLVRVMENGTAFAKKIFVN